MYTVKFSKKADKAYKKLPRNIQSRIDEKLEYLRQTPRGTDTKKLSGMDGLYRTQVGNYRIVFEIEDNELVVWIVDVGPRGSIYQ